MIDYFDNMLRHLFLANVDEIKDESQVQFEPPDDKWRTYVSNLTVSGNPVNALNVYLADVKENRTLRSNERVRDFQNGVVTETRAPRRIDCHYLISAWSPAQVTPAVEPSLDEHALLYKATGALMNAEPLVPRRIYDPNPLPLGFPDVIADAELPSIILPPEGFPKLAEFWGATKTVHWKPTIYFIVTLPVVLQTDIAGPMVTTRITEYRASGNLQTSETWIQIGGTVLTGMPAEPVAEVWVRIEDNLGTAVGTTTTEANGRFTFGGLRQGSYTLRVRAPGFGEATRNVQVPSPTGNYDMQLS
jgi:hypothetical protein